MSAFIEAISGCIEDGHMPGVQSQILHAGKQAIDSLPDAWELQDGTRYTKHQLLVDAGKVISHRDEKIRWRGAARLLTAIVEDCYAARRKPVPPKRKKEKGDIWAGNGALPEYNPDRQVPLNLADLVRLLSQSEYTAALVSASNDPNRFVRRSVEGKTRDQILASRAACAAILKHAKETQ